MTTTDPRRSSWIAARNLREDCTAASRHLDRVIQRLYWAETTAGTIAPGLQRRANTLLNDAYNLNVAIAALATEGEVIVWDGDHR